MKIKFAILPLFAACVLVSSCQTNSPPSKTAEYSPQTPGPLPSWTKSKGKGSKSAGQVKILTKLIEISYEPGAEGIPEKRYQRRMNAAQSQAFLRTMSRRKGADLMTSPSVTLRSGQTGKVAVVREFVYPSDKSSDDTKKVDLGVTQYFRARALGSRQKYQLDTVVDVTGMSGFQQDGKGKEQPVFENRRIDESVHLGAGETIVFGGLVTDDKQQVEDKIPHLGDLPLIGRLFRSRKTVPLKRELIVMVQLGTND